MDLALRKNENKLQRGSQKFSKRLQHLNTFLKPFALKKHQDTTLTTIYLI
jgi:hypothetical protein